MYGWQFYSGLLQLWDVSSFMSIDSLSTFSVHSTLAKFRLHLKEE